LQFGVIGSGSWGTALAKILTDNQAPINWWVRDEATITHLKTRHHNPNYISSVYFDGHLLTLSSNLHEVISNSDCLVVAVPSAYIIENFSKLPEDIFSGKKVISAVKGLLPEDNMLLNDYLKKYFGLGLDRYFTVMGPCHAEEVAAEKLSYLTFSGQDDKHVQQIASYFSTPYISTVVNGDIYGVQFAAIMKNIYALGAGMAHGLEYGDNFLSVYIANCADEMAGFLRKAGVNPDGAGIHRHDQEGSLFRSLNYAASVYLGDLLVTCYSLHSRNRTFGNMIGKGYSVKTATLELSMVAEGYNASKCIFLLNKQFGAEIPIVEAIYRILWENVKVRPGFKQIEQLLV
jgi:glycerol-3-phosphate dehydrogenase (NAD(P)+)